MQQILPITQAQRLRRLAERAVEQGDLTFAYNTSKQLQNLLEGSDTPTKELAENLYDLGVICSTLDRLAEADRYLGRAIELLSESQADADSWMLNETKAVLSSVRQENAIAFQVS